MVDATFSLRTCRRCDRENAPVRSIFGFCVACSSETLLLHQRKLYPRIWLVKQAIKVAPSVRIRLWAGVRKRLISNLGRSTLAEWLGLDMHRLEDPEPAIPTIIGAVRVLGYLAYVEARRVDGDEYPLDAQHAIQYVSAAHSEYQAHASALALERVETSPRSRRKRT